MNTSQSGFTLIELMIVVAIIAIIAAIAIPSILRSRISANQTSAVASLDTIFKMNTQFRSNDSDNDGENNYWAENVWGLYGVKSAGGDRIELFSKSLALSDYEGAGDFGSTDPSEASSFSIDASFGTGDETPKSGYYVSMFTGQASSGTSCGSDDCYTAGGDTNGGGGPSCSDDSGVDHYRNDNRFSVSAFPSLYNNTGTKAYAIDQGGDKFEIDAKATTGVGNRFNDQSSDEPSSSAGTAPNECLPDEDTLNSDWGTVG